MAAPAIGIRPRWSPGPGARLDRLHPISTGLMACHIPRGGGGAVDVVNGYDLAQSGAPTSGGNAFGPGLANTAANAGATLTIGTAHPLSLNAPLSIMWVGSHDAVPAASCVYYGAIFDNAAGSPFLCYSLDGGGGGGVNPTVEYNQAGAYASLGSPSGYTGGLNVYIATLSAAVISLWVNGLRVNTNTGPTTINYSATSYISMNIFTGTSRTTNTTVNMGAIWNRALSSNEIATLSADPFCMLRW